MYVVYTCIDIVYVHLLWMTRISLYYNMCIVFVYIF